MNKTLKKAARIFLLLAAALLILQNSPVPVLADQAANVHLKIDRMEFTDDRTAFTVYCSVINDSSFVIPEYSAVFTFPEKAKSGLDLTNAETFRWEGDAPADSDNSGNEKQEEIRIASLNPGEVYAFSFGCRADIPETEKKTRLQAALGITVSLRDAEKPEWGGSSESTLPIDFDTFVRPAPVPETTTAAPTETAAKQISLNGWEKGSEEISGGKDLVVYAAEDTTQPAAGQIAEKVQETCGTGKSSVGLIGILTAVCLILLGLLIRLAVRYREEHRRKFRPDQDK